MELIHILIFLPISVLIGVGASLISLTAWNLVVPLSFCVFKYDILESVYLSLLVDFSTNLALTVVYRKRVCWELVVIGACIIVPIVFGMTFFSAWFLEKYQTLLFNLIGPFAAILGIPFLISGYKLLKAPKDEDGVALIGEVTKDYADIDSYESISYDNEDKIDKIGTGALPSMSESVCPTQSQSVDAKEIIMADSAPVEPQCLEPLVGVALDTSGGSLLLDDSTHTRSSSPSSTKGETHEERVALRKARRAARKVRRKAKIAEMRNTVTAWNEVKHEKKRVVKYCLLLAASCIYVGILGFSGGMLMAVVLVFAFKFEMLQATATSNAQVVVMTFVCVVSHSFRLTRSNYHEIWPYMIMMPVLAIGGAIISAKFAMKLSEGWCRIIVGIATVLSAIAAVFQVFVIQ
ncbi:Transmembrane protein TauE-like protein [Aduncisulcus paluster]|uniref:Transmembrane protein TauE-like protein n=1 Tax=Aduncisulcus paluster TaxID=2918883 RepID=A0ABQ5KX95_9EUKA|nr:Transmembrane protein TauE-like protein [Aduncisulcus paluster]|eukprot:gnl/Carplike_NY0171/2642_a3551_421.p1 GENE.gnl/Carplike_NY0171/2642_a3551_421~~gnl/Carplike_NY0171/2642_a3551_421.p1  ORF type:complete len:406 (-),score=82.37 gnl/Carplike_NY0171/2642_a3551_421:244-1461(-)